MTTFFISGYEAIYTRIYIYRYPVVAIASLTIESRPVVKHVFKTAAARIMYYYNISLLRVRLRLCALYIRIIIAEADPVSSAHNIFTRYISYTCICAL